MATHFEIVHGPLGETSILPCACPRQADHPRLNSDTAPVPIVESAALEHGRRARRQRRAGSALAAWVGGRPSHPA
ncbi:hypothetical protein FLP10_04710 [Agromyces intestinalis]|uniref:Uncharacterized protein n=1 Tax=Agromyces intestinalis TaxID=2592652 RepID=A0A5C1YGC2_9MICO|nr:hypothetical protein [Agromyces intestinalis]QEO13802.1 hypothetical protein FLP10_04710 [Agromyces intestinalis]